jgi:tRNA(fMet)-specific endonuclease VapC
MMILDSDHFSEFLKGTSSAALRLRQRLEAATEPVVVTIITAEELMRGWLSLIHRQRAVRAQIFGYAELRKLISTLGRWDVLPWDDAAASQFENLRSQKVRIGTMDLKIASIALSQNAIVLTRNRVDFEQVANLQTEDWQSDVP